MLSGSLSQPCTNICVNIPNGKTNKRQNREDPMQKYRFQTLSRYYTIQMQQDLFGCLVVVCCWGSKFSKQGGCKTIPAETEEGADKIIRQITKRREAHGYV